MKNRVNIGALKAMGKLPAKVYGKVAIDKKLKEIRANKRKYGSKK